MKQRKDNKKMKRTLASCKTISGGLWVIGILEAEERDDIKNI